jgi:hypothetical protein
LRGPWPEALHTSTLDISGRICFTLEVTSRSEQPGRHGPGIPVKIKTFHARMFRADAEPHSIIGSQPKGTAKRSVQTYKLLGKSFGPN